jgi:hypothetical protein
MSKHSSAEVKLHISPGLRNQGKYSPQKASMSQTVPRLEPKRANFKNQYR